MTKKHIFLIINFFPLKFSWTFLFMGLSMFFDTNFFWFETVFGPQKFLGPKYFGPTNFFRPCIFLYINFLWPKLFFWPEIFWPKSFSYKLKVYGTQISFLTQNVLTQTFTPFCFQTFLTQIIFWTLNYCKLINLTQNLLSQFFWLKWFYTWNSMLT